MSSQTKPTQFVGRYLEQMQIIMTVEWAELVCGKGRENSFSRERDEKKPVPRTPLLPTFIFSNGFVLLMVEEDLEPVLGSLGVRQKHTLNGAPLFTLLYFGE